MSELAPEDLRTRLEAGEPLTLLDVREPHERSYCAIAVPPTAGDLFIPLRTIPNQVGVVQEALRRGPLVVYCHHGFRSRNVAQWLAGLGLSGVLNLKGGIDAWSREADSAVPRYH
ncbi:MAG: rhodanese-like domain-containing protein [Isosphaeraceae bacterium]